MFELESFTTSFQNDDRTGILLVDKPSGWTSHDVVARVRRVTNIKRVGHSGTLDPLATGLLIVLVGREYTKLQDIFLKQDKEYVCTFELGKTTDSFDSDGLVTSTAPWEKVAPISKEQVQSLVATFIGSQSQTVPAFSAVKVGGQKMYELARKQQVVELPKRQVTIHQLEVVSFNTNEASQQVTVTIRVSASSGTYIRSLAHDIGQKLGVGATVTALRRTKIGKISVDNAQVV
jgi:tRNA pseudouridine55 synthase